MSFSVCGWLLYHQASKVACSRDLQGCLCSQLSLPEQTFLGDSLGHLLGRFIPLAGKATWTIHFNYWRTEMWRKFSPFLPQLWTITHSKTHHQYCSEGCSGQSWTLLFWAGVVWVVTNLVRPAMAQALAVAHSDSLGYHPQGEQRTWSTLGSVLQPESDHV